MNGFRLLCGAMLIVLSACAPPAPREKGPPLGSGEGTVTCLFNGQIVIHEIGPYDKVWVDDDGTWIKPRKKGSPWPYGKAFTKYSVVVPCVYETREG